MTTKSNVYDKLEEFYNGDVPAYISSAGKTFITIKTSDWSGEKSVHVTIKDVIKYYRVDARNISSGMRTLAGYSGDWRPIDNLARECLEWFKFINREELAKEGRKYGMDLKQ